MVYYKSWATFQSQCLELYAQNPAKTRYLIKAHPASQWLTLKVTDDKKTIKFKTRSAAILHRFESFTKDLAASMVGLPMPSQLQAEAEATAAAEAASAAAQAAAATAMDVDGDSKGAKSSQASGGKPGNASGSGAGKAASGSAGGATGGGASGGGGGKKKKKKGKK